MKRNSFRDRTSNKKQALCNLFAAYIHTIPLEELIETVERARLEAKLRYVVIYGAACSYCLARAERLEGSYLQTFALGVKGIYVQKVKVTRKSLAVAYENLSILINKNVIEYPNHPELLAELEVFKSGFTLDESPDYSNQIALNPECTRCA